MYEPTSEPLHISAKKLFLNWKSDQLEAAQRLLLTPYTLQPKPYRRSPTA